MGYYAKRQLIFISICLLVAAVLIHYKASISIQNNRISLSEMFSQIDGWETLNNVEIDESTIEALDLDDFLFRSYRSGSSVVSIYIGYYYTAEKIGAAHSPLVCFPGQGWEISPPVSVGIETQIGRINAEKILIKKGKRKELILYWYQAYDMTSPGTLFQKINSLLVRIQSKPEDNAFIRVSMEVPGENIEVALKSTEAFIKEVYPVLLNSYLSKR